MLAAERNIIANVVSNFYLNLAKNDFGKKANEVSVNHDELTVLVRLASQFHTYLPDGEWKFIYDSCEHFAAFLSVQYQDHKIIQADEEDFEAAIEEARQG